MKVDTKVDGQRVYLTLEGKMYSEGAASLREEVLRLLEKGHVHIVIEMKSLTYIDSSGLGVLVGLKKKIVQNAGSFVLKGLRGVVKELFELTRLTTVFSIVEGD